MARNPKAVAVAVLEAFGGRENIYKVSHCATRLRVELHDDKKMNKQAFDSIEGVNGYFFQSGQHQVILGTGFVNKVFAEFEKMGIAESQGEKEEEESTSNKGKMQQLTKTFADIFIPVIPVLIATGLLMGLRGLLINGFGMEMSGTILKLSQVLTDTAFTFIPVLVTWSAMKKFGGSPVIGVALGLMLVAPQLPDKWAVSFGEAEPLLLPFLGFDIPITGMQSSILPAVFMGWLAAKIEKSARKYIPEVLDLILTPFVTLLFSLILGLVMVGPLILGIENLITSGIMYFFELPFGLGGFIYGGAIQFLAITGMHHTIVPITVKMVAETGYDLINPIGTAAIAGQAGAALAVVLQQKNRIKRSNMFGSVIPAFLGITEPVMFAINLPKVKPFLFGCLGGAVGGGLASILGIAAAGTGSTMLPGLLLYIGGGFFQYILVILVALAVSFLVTFFVYREKQEEEVEHPEMNYDVKHG
ncbi:PTS sugar transporter subunit IIA [Halobacillus halophilus]|uniref:PTS system subunit IIBC, sucrose-specific n=1 Tax=Halobacillus halophilus (strain ATCC 35676 / DSM 2266 / JCM 20832 / KCTC 3685 / LMG 17431 / NBRC 102448 / NCIMB 2269) TaxID=866895 RepID=I0JKD6_HALH3|nr:PTS transporter subunit EIIC [Halobacillus halophilus]ASF38752.1 PTS sugar transporter subunit IIA [Halobacillus halophilus]CCG44605.1 PTS system subunit IIBC, sucrose-specific [Halobacillus halophilus DSM 2266]